jgi:ribosomal protein S18 acetylase RimI-like enzyme
MAEGGRDSALRAMARNRGCRLVRSRRRTPGVGDYGRYGLEDSATGKAVLGFGPGGLTATAEEVEDFLRGGLAADWKKSLSATPEAPRAARKRAARPAREAADPAPPPPPPPPPSPPSKPAPKPAPKLQVREAKAGDAEAIAALVTALGFAAAETDVARRLAALRRAGEPPLVAVEEEVLGILAWHVTPVLHRPAPVGRVTMMVVAEAARGRGVGTALVEAAEARLAAKGCGLVEVTSNIELGGAHAFYRRRGFERTSYRFAKPLGTGR